MKKTWYKMAFVLVILVTGIHCSAQDNDRALLRKVVKENQDAVYAIAMYPTETRKIIFQACEYPEVIAKLNAMQTNSQDAFVKLIADFSKDEQEKIWNLTRYDGLIADIAANPQMPDDDFNNILVNYPEEIHQTAIDEKNNHADLIIRIDKMNQDYNSAFELLMNDYPPEVADVFRQMIKMPDVLDILFDHMQYTVVVGDYYKKNPERVIHKTDSINLALTQKNTQQADDWEQTINDDPEVKEEYTQAAKDYAEDIGYQPQDYTAPMTQDITYYHSDPYNWWFGYPTWYPYNYWNPYPYWYDWGFYFGSNGQVVFFGLPSAYFMNWFFYYPDHCLRYAELSSHYYNYYDRHRDAMNYNSISRSVNDWRNRNRDIITPDWDNDKINRTQRFREYGKMETERKEYNAKNPKKQVDRAEYIQKERKKYPVLSEDVTKNQILQSETKTKTGQEPIAEPVKKPAVRVNENVKVTTNEHVTGNQYEQKVQPQNSNIQNTNVNKQSELKYSNPQPINNVLKPKPESAPVKTANPAPVKQTENFNQIRNAQEYHQNTWNQIQKQTQPARQPQQQNVAPSPKQQEYRQVQQPAKQNTQPPSNPKKK
jgi:hypothetical protein